MKKSHPHTSKRTRTAKSALKTRFSFAKKKVKTPADALDIDSNRRLLNRYRFALHQEMRILAGWLPKVSNFELKCELGRAIWENAVHVNDFYLRLREIQSPAFQKPSDAAFVAVFSELLHAPDEYALAL